MHVPAADDPAFFSLFEGRNHDGLIVPHGQHHKPETPGEDGNKFRLLDPISGIGRVVEMPDESAPAMMFWPCAEIYRGQPGDVMANNRVSVDKAGASQNSAYGISLCTIDGQVPLAVASTYYEAPASPFLPDVLEVQNQWTMFNHGLRVAIKAHERGVFVRVKAQTFGGAVVLDPEDGSVDRSMMPVPLRHGGTKLTEDMLPALRERAAREPSFALWIDEKGVLRCGKRTLRVGRKYAALPDGRQGWVPLVNMSYRFTAKHGETLVFDSGQSITLPTLEEVEAGDDRELRLPTKKIDGWAVFRPCWTPELRQQMRMGHLEGVPQKTAAAEPVKKAGTWIGHNGEELYRHHAEPLQRFMPPLDELRAIRGVGDLSHYQPGEMVSVLRAELESLRDKGEAFDVLHREVSMVLDSAHEIASGNG